MIENTNREYTEFTRVLKVLITEVFDNSEHLDEEWSYNSDVAVGLMRIAAEIVVKEELMLPAMGTLGSGKALFAEWAERSYVLARDKAIRVIALNAKVPQC